VRRRVVIPVMPTQCIRFRLVPRVEVLPPHRHSEPTAQVLQDKCRSDGPRSLAVKLSIKAELAYSFADATQIIANIEASHTSDQSVLTETLDFQPTNRRTAIGEFEPPSPAM
jgi:hypothetical protein